MVIESFRKVWLFAKRVRRGVEAGNSLALLTFVSEHDENPQVRKMALRQLADLQKSREEKVVG